MTLSLIWHPRTTRPIFGPALLHGTLLARLWSGTLEPRRYVGRERSSWVGSLQPREWTGRLEGRTWSGRPSDEFIPDQGRFGD